MGRLRRHMQIVAAVVGVVLLCIAGVGVVTNLRWVALVPLFLVGIIALGLLAHMHQRVSDTMRAVLRAQQQADRERERAVRRARREAAEADRVERQRRRETQQQQKDLIKVIRAAVEHDLVVTQGRITARLDALEHMMRTVGRELRDASGTLNEQGRRVSDDLDRYHRILQDGVAGDVAGLRVDVQELRARSDEAGQALAKLRHEPVTEIDALLQIHRRFPIGGAVPLTWGWALSPRALLQVLDLVERPECLTVVECGSGTSTIYLGWLLRERLGARVIALEHLDEVADSTEERVRALGLDHVVEVRRAPLRPIAVGGRQHTWYDTSSIDDLKGVDLLLVDGPPGATGAYARYPALPLFASRLNNGAIVALDDAGRPDEKAVWRMWCEELGGKVVPTWSITSNLGLLEWRGEGEHAST